MENWKNLIPWGLVVPFLIIILIEYVISRGLIFYNRRLSQDIEILEVKLKQMEENLQGGLEINPFFKVFSQAVNIVEILKTKPSLALVIERFNELMPNFLIIKEFKYDADQGEVEITAATQNWQDYLRFHKYVDNLEVLKIKSLTPPKVDEENLVSFSMVFLLKPAFYQR